VESVLLFWARTIEQKRKNESDVNSFCMTTSKQDFWKWLQTLILAVYRVIINFNKKRPSSGFSFPGALCESALACIVFRSTVSQICE
jgi:hypothetical protein